MAIEDLTTYTEEDPGSDLTVTSSKVTAAGMDGNVVDYLYKDFGTSYFDGIDLVFSCRISSSSGLGASGDMGFSNDGETCAPWTGIYISFELNRSGVSEYYASLNYTDYCYINSNTIYYCRLIRLAGSDTVTVHIYSDSGMTSLVDTLTATGLGTTKFRYFYPIANYWTNKTGTQFYGYYQNFNFIKSSAGQVRFIGMMM